MHPSYERATKQRAKKKKKRIGAQALVPKRFSFNWDRYRADCGLLFLQLKDRLLRCAIDILPPYCLSSNCEHPANDVIEVVASNLQDQSPFDTINLFASYVQNRNDPTIEQRDKVINIFIAFSRILIHPVSVTKHTMSFWSCDSLCSKNNNNDNNNNREAIVTTNQMIQLYWNEMLQHLSFHCIKSKWFFRWKYEKKKIVVLLINWINE